MQNLNIKVYKCCRQKLLSLNLFLDLRSKETTTLVPTTTHFPSIKKSMMERDQGNKLMHWCRTVKSMDMIESATFCRA